MHCFQEDAYRLGYPMTINTASCSTLWPAVTSTLRTTPRTDGANLVLHLHRFQDHQRLIFDDLIAILYQYLHNHAWDWRSDGEVALGQGGPLPGLR